MIMGYQEESKKVENALICHVTVVWALEYFYGVARQCWKLLFKKDPEPQQTIHFLFKLFEKKNFEAKGEHSLFTSINNLSLPESIGSMLSLGVGLGGMAGRGVSAGWKNLAETSAKWSKGAVKAFKYAKFGFAALGIVAEVYDMIQTSNRENKNIDDFFKTHSKSLADYFPKLKSFSEENEKFLENVSESASALYQAVNIDE